MWVQYESGKHQYIDDVEVALSEAGKVTHPNLRANCKSISHRCHPILVAFVWELT